MIDVRAAASLALDERAARLLWQSRTSKWPPTFRILKRQFDRACVIVRANRSLPRVLGTTVQNSSSASDETDTVQRHHHTVGARRQANAQSRSTSTRAATGEPAAGEGAPLAASSRLPAHERPIVYSPFCGPALSPPALEWCSPPRRGARRPAQPGSVLTTFNASHANVAPRRNGRHRRRSRCFRNESPARKRRTLLHAMWLVGGITFMGIVIGW